MFGSITSGGALADDGDVNDWPPSCLGAALDDDDDVNDWAHHVWEAALDDDDVNDWPVTTSFGGYV